MKMRSLEMAVAFNDGTWEAGHFVEIPVSTYPDKLEIAGRIKVLLQDWGDRSVAHVWLYNSMDDDVFDVADAHV